MLETYLMSGMRKYLLLIFGFLTFTQILAQKESTKVLLFGDASASSSFLKQFSAQFKLDTTSKTSVFSENSLKNYQAVVFLNQSSNNLSFRESAELQRFMKAGGGFVGIHSTAEKSYKWLWFENMLSGKLAETQYENKVQLSLITNATIGKISLSPLWKIEDKPLIFNNLPIKCKPVLMDLMGKTWAWYYTTDEGGKMFYTALGGEKSAFENTDFINLIIAATQEVASKTLPDYAKITQTALPNDANFLKIVLSNNLQNPVSFCTLPDGNAIIAEQNGNLKVFSETSRQTKIVGKIDATNLKEIKLDPEFNTNHYVYTFSENGSGEYKIGRFEMLGDSSILNSDFASQSTTPLQKNAVYDYSLYESAAYRLPKYYDKKSFRYDDTQGFIVETLDENDDVKNIEPFLPSFQFNFIQDLEFGKDGALYFLENNQLLKIDYTETNRKPIAKASADVISGNAPLKVKFSSAGSIDFDPTDKLSYEWSFDGATSSYEPNPEFTFTKAGDYEVKLKVTDSKNDVSEASILIKVLPKGVKKK